MTRVALVEHERVHTPISQFFCEPVERPVNGDRTFGDGVSSGTIISRPLLRRGRSYVPNTRCPDTVGSVCGGVAGHAEVSSGRSSSRSSPRRWCRVTTASVTRSAGTIIEVRICVHEMASTAMSRSTNACTAAPTSCGRLSSPVPTSGTLPTGFLIVMAPPVAATSGPSAASPSAVVPVVVQMGITMVYRDGGDRWLDESAPWDVRPERRALVDPVAALENAVHDLIPSGSAQVILRAARFVGPGTAQDQQRDQLRRGTLTVPADRPSYISLVHVADAVDAAVNAAVDGRVNEAVLNVSDEPVRTHEYLDGLARLDGLDPPSRTVGAEISHRVDSSAARDLLRWRPRRGIWPNPKFPPGH